MKRMLNIGRQPLDSFKQIRARGVPIPFGVRDNGFFYAPWMTRMRRLWRYGQED